MEKVVGKLLVATGLLISGSVALLPLTSHAMTNVGGVFDCKGVTNPTGGNATSTASGVKDPAGAKEPQACATATYSSEAGTVKKLDKDGNEVLDEDGNPVMIEGTTDGTTQVNVNVKDVIAMDVTNPAGSDGRTSDTGSDGVKLIAFPDMVSHGRIYANVRSARPYTISLSAATPYLTNVEDDSFIIPARDNPTTGTSGWGVATGFQGSFSAVDFDAQDYKAITSTPTVFYDSDVANDDITTTNFPVAVAVSAKLPQGTYVTEVTVTASVKQ